MTGRSKHLRGRRARAAGAAGARGGRGLRVHRRLRLVPLQQEGLRVQGTLLLRLLQGAQAAAPSLLQETQASKLAAVIIISNISIQYIMSYNNIRDILTNVC